MWTLLTLLSSVIADFDMCCNYKEVKKISGVVSAIDFRLLTRGQLSSFDNLVIVGLSDRRSQYKYANSRREIVPIRCQPFEAVHDVLQAGLQGLHVEPVQRDGRGHHKIRPCMMSENCRGARFSSRGQD